MSMTRVMFAVPVAALLLAGRADAAEPAAAKPAKADAQKAQAEELSTLRAQVEKLSQELEALKARPTPATFTPPPAEASPAVTPAQVTDLSERLDLLEVQQKDAVVAGDIPGSFRVPGTEISLRLYGFVELNWVHLFQGDNSDQDYATFPPYLPLEGSPEAKRKNRDYLHARTSRLGLEAGTPTRFGVVGVKVEGDFNNEPRTGDAAQYGAIANVYTQQITSSYGFRVRHAYGTFGGLLAGQTWSTFMDVDNYPETVDYNGPTGATFIRQALVRYTYGTQKWGSFTAAIENSSSYVIEPTVAGEASRGSLSRVPDFVVRWDKGFEWGALSARAVTHELHFDDRFSSGDASGATATARGYGAAVSASFKIPGGGWLAMQATGGEGIGRYLNYVEGAIYDPGSDEIELERAAGVLVGYQHKPADWVRVNLVYGANRTFENDYTDLAKATGFAGDPSAAAGEFEAGRFGVNKYVQQVHLGPIFTVAPGVELGVECIWAQRKTLAGEKGDDLRANVSFKYYIN